MKCGKVDIKTHLKARESYFEQVDIEFRSKGTVLTKEKDGGDGEWEERGCEFRECVLM